MKTVSLKWIVIGIVVVLLGVGVYVECTGIRHTHPPQVEGQK